MAIDLAQLRAIARGDLTSKMGRNVVTTPSGTTGYASGYAKKPRSYAGYASYAQNLQGKEKDDVEGVTGGVSEEAAPPVAVIAPAPAVFSFDPLAIAEKRNCEAARLRQTDRWCGCCGRMATVAVGRFRASSGNPEGVASWRCVECFERGRVTVAGGKKFK